MQILNTLQFYIDAVNTSVQTVVFPLRDMYVWYRQVAEYVYCARRFKIELCVEASAGKLTRGKWNYISEKNIYTEEEK